MIEFYLLFISHIFYLKSNLRNKLLKKSKIGEKDFHQVIALLLLEKVKYIMLSLPSSPSLNMVENLHLQSMEYTSKLQALEKNQNSSYTKRAPTK